MDAFYTSFDKRVKEKYQCNYRSNTKEGPYTEWHRNGRMRFEGHFTRGRLNGASTAWYESGQREAEENTLNGQLHGRVTRLEGRNRNLRFSAEPNIGHWIHWHVYPGREVYDWLLRYDRKSRR